MSAGVALGLALTHPRLMPEWDRARNGALDPGTITPGSGRLVWWVCARDGTHRWRARVYMRAQRGTGCPVCALRAPAPRRRHPSISAGRPDLLVEWHPTRNGALSPERVSLGSKRRIWWRCATDPAHEWSTEVHVRTLKGSGCPFCCGRMVDERTCLSATHPQIAAEWHPRRNPLGPDQVGAGSSLRAWWCCAEGHEWQVSVSVRIAKATGCPRCANRRRTRSG